MRLRLICATISALAFVLVTTGCGGTSVTELGGATALKCLTSLGSAVPSFPASGGQAVLTIVAARECTWTAAGDASWVQLSPASGQGETNVTLTVAQNTQTRSRTAHITVNDQRFPVTQEARPSSSTPSPSPTPQPPPGANPTQPSSCGYAIDRDARSFGRKGGEATIKVTASSACPWVALSTAGWISITSGSAGIGSGEIRYRVAPFSGNGERQGSILVAGLRHTVTQRGQNREDDDDDDDDD